MNPFIPSGIDSIVPLLFFYKNGFDHESWYTIKTKKPIPSLDQINLPENSSHSIGLIFIRASYQAGFHTRSFLIVGVLRMGRSCAVCQRQSAMCTIRAFARSSATKPGGLAGHRFTTPEGFVQCETIVVIVWLPDIYTKWPGARP